MTMPTVWIGWDAAEMVACNVAMQSLKRTSHIPPHVRRLSLLELRERSLYSRPTEVRFPGHQLWDVRSNAPMSTEHAIARFFVPMLMHFHGWALFTDGDVLFRTDVQDIFDLADDRYAVQVVQHPPLVAEGTKKDGVPQQAYPRKNWSSVMLFNCAHPKHLDLTVEMLNTVPGRDLHRFCWLEDSDIGELPASWNYLVNVNAMPDPVHLAHYTLGVPALAGHECDPFADEWFAMARKAGYTNVPNVAQVG